MELMKKKFVSPAIHLMDLEKTTMKNNRPQPKVTAQQAAKTVASGKALVLKNEYKKIVKLPLSSKKYRTVIVPVR